MTGLFDSLITILNEMSPYILLGFILAGLLHVFVRPEVMTRHLAGHGWKPIFKAALFGIPLPLCSCGVLPTTVALRRQGASKGASTSFLIATPQTGVDSITATYSLLGLPFAIIRPIAALFGALGGGMAVDIADRKKHDATNVDNQDTPITDNCTDNCCSTDNNHNHSEGFIHKLYEALRYGLIDMVASVGKWLVIGLIVAAMITVAVPDSLFTGLAKYPIIAMLVMVIVAVPMYVCATGSIPIAMSLMLKGLTPGVGFVLLMAGPAANFASVMVLRRTLGSRTTYIYIVAVVITAIAFGMIIDYLLPASWFLPQMHHISGHSHGAGLFETSCSVILIILLIYSAIRNFSRSHKKLTLSKNDMKHIYNIGGMSCPHCQATVEKALRALPGVNDVVVNLHNGTAEISGEISDDAVKQAISLAGFEFIDKSK